MWKLWKWKQTFTIRRTLRSGALGEKNAIPCDCECSSASWLSTIWQFNSWHHIVLVDLPDQYHNERNACQHAYSSSHCAVSKLCQISFLCLSCRGWDLVILKSLVFARPACIGATHACLAARLRSSLTRVLCRFLCVKPMLLFWLHTHAKPHERVPFYVSRTLWDFVIL